LEKKRAKLQAIILKEKDKILKNKKFDQIIQSNLNSGSPMDLQQIYLQVGEQDAILSPQKDDLVKQLDVWLDIKNIFG
jgi:hypothetical protein